jgi:formylglycine-generating enzyme required for sulfatase activity
VVCVSWIDAKKYVEWLSSKTGQQYRLLTSSEWEYVARAGTQTTRAWGKSPSRACEQTNVADLAASGKFSDWLVHDCNDDYIYTSPVTALKENTFGIAGLMGNVFEWVEDCWNESYSGAPDDGSAWVEGECSSRILRGGSWFSQPQYVRSAFQNHFDSNHRASTFGIRVARDL